MDFRLIYQSDSNKVIEHLRMNFIADEPLNDSVSLCKMGEPHLALENHCLETLKDGLSIMAIDTVNGKIAGLALNGILKEGDVQIAKKNLKLVPDTKFQQIFNFLYTINEELNLFKLYSVNSIFEFRLLSVDKDYRGQKLSKELLSRSEIIAKQAGYKIVKADATSYFSQKVCENMGMKTVKEIRYADHLDNNGQMIFHTKAPHSSLKILIKEINAN